VEGDELSSCIIVPAEAAGPAGPKLSKINALAFSLLKKLLSDGGEQPRADLSLPAGYRVVKMVAWREAFYAAHPSGKQGTKQRAFVRAHLDLFEQGLITFHGEFVSVCPDKPDKNDF
jgi:hypothetical protein